MIEKDAYNVLSTKVHMLKRCADCIRLALILAIVALPLGTLCDTNPVNAAQRTLCWSIVSTPNDGTGGMIASPSEINAFAMGPDNRTFYAADDNNSILYKSIDAGVTWYPDIGNRLIDPAAGGQMPVWDLAVSPDDANFVIAITDGGTGTPGPKNVFFSSDGGSNWRNTGFPSLAPGEYISCVAISKIYASINQSRDIAVGTRNGLGTGSVYAKQYNNTPTGNWNIQGALPGDFTSLKFSPNYDIDNTVCAIYSTSNTFLTFGKHDVSNNTTIWNTTWNDLTSSTIYPVPLGIATASTIIKSGLELPSDFDGTIPEQLGVFASIQAAGATGVFYINPFVSTAVFNITPPMSGPITGRISSIAYNGSQSTGILLAGEANANPNTGLVNVWRSSNPQSLTIGGATWLKSDEIKSPTGGAASGRANAILSWSPDGENAYCGTSSENATAGGTGFNIANPGQWPISKLTGMGLDESAFSLSHNSGQSWNQISLIDTQIDHLTDVAALEIDENAANEDISSVLYLATAENTADNFSSVWRSTSDPLGSIWERILLRPKTNNMGSILRVNPRKDNASKAVVFADLDTDNITYSADQGQSWVNIHAGASLNDISLKSDSRMYVLDDFTVRQVNQSDSGWTLGTKLNTNLDSPGHTVSTPLNSPGNTEIVLVGSDFGVSSVAWADFSQIIARFTTLKPLPSNNSYVHVIPDYQYEQNQIIYAGVNINSLPVTDSSEGTIYRWKIGKSTSWDDLEPTNDAFFGIESLNGLLYGLWNSCITDPGYTGGGVDRTLYPTIPVPPAPEWDGLISGLPQTTTGAVKFTREPTALKTSSGINNTLWAIDNYRPYLFNLTTGKGCLWS
ncbi:MAG: hypothetical protein EHM12_00985, partial [Dehalococcoidia bacterium]